MSVALLVTLLGHAMVAVIHIVEARSTIWVILSCTEGWGKDVCLVPGELNEMHRHSLSCI
jgi:hypothetical protein